LTAEDCALDAHSLVQRQPITLYRLAKAKYANLSGVGAAVEPGRWNRLGMEAIYTSTEIGVPLLERLAHTPKDQIPSDLAMMKIRINGVWEVFSGVSTCLALKGGGGSIPVYSTLLQARERYHGNPTFGPQPWGDNFAMAVPSVIVPVWNVVLYPQASGFWHHVSLESVEPFEFDPRLFPEGTPVESAL
jgi:RES domain-containing protein